MLLMRRELRPEVPDDRLLDALLTTEVAFAADAENLTSLEGQSALVGAIGLTARSGAQCYLDVPNVDLPGVTAPLTSPLLVDGLLDLGLDLIPGRSFEPRLPAHEVDLAVVLGDSRWRGLARRIVRLSGDAWRGRIAPQGERWTPRGSPFGALASSGLAAGEAYKAAMRRLGDWAPGREVFDALFADALVAEVALAPPGTPAPTRDLGHFDFVSGGAIIHAALYALSRIPRATAHARVIEPESNELSNVNRYWFLRSSRLEEKKATHLASLDLGDLRITAVPRLYCDRNLNEIGPLAHRVLVGVDHIPSRWAVQQARPSWLGIGATSDHFVQVTFHSAGLCCACCLHPDGMEAPRKIPTVAFVSHWAGLWLASIFARVASGLEVPRVHQQTTMWTLRPDSRSAIQQSQGVSTSTCELRCPL